MRKITAVLLIMMLVLCGCDEEVSHDTAVAPTLPQKSEISDNENGSTAVESKEDFSFEQADTLSESPDHKEHQTVKAESAETEITPKPKKAESTERVPEAETEPEFDIDCWVAFAKSYAEEVGLELNSGAADCWDNPISANSRCIYLERDICDRLNRYSASEEITDVWIWPEALGNGSYNIYIGYA